MLVCTCIIHVRFTLISVYNRHGYISIVSRLAEQSMQTAFKEVQALPDYTTKGEITKLVTYTCIMYE